MAPSQATSSGNRMTHSISTPSGVDGSASSVSRGSKKLAIRIQMLDDSVTLFQVQVISTILNWNIPPISNKISHIFVICQYGIDLHRPKR